MGAEIDYRTAAAMDAHDPRRRPALLLSACASVACIGALLLTFEARRQYLRVVAMPAERVTSSQRLERAVVRVATGFDRTYASRPRYVTATVITVTRAALHAALAWYLWRLAGRDGTGTRGVRRVAISLIITAPIALVAWFFFSRNVGAVRDSFDLLGDRLGFSTALFLAGLLGILFSTAYAVAALRLSQPEPPVARLIVRAPFE
jgi:hypothetical protein